MKKLFYFQVFILIFVTAIKADTIHVPGNYATIQDGIDAATSSDTVLVADGIYTGVGNKNIDFLGKSVEVISENGPENCVIDCEGSGRGFIFQNDENEYSILSGFSIRNGFSVGGGGIYIHGESEGYGPMIQNCIISNNAVESDQAKGGGIFCEYADPTIIDCIVDSNTARGNSAKGAGIYCWQSIPIIRNCTIRENIAFSSEPGNNAFGGGIYICDGPFPATDIAVIEDCEIADNYAAGMGGGLYLIFVNFEIINSEISGNQCLYYGGGISALGGPGFGFNVTIMNCTITNNSSENGVGGSFGATGGINMTECDMTISNTLIANNTSDYSGVGIEISFGKLTLINSTIVNNNPNIGGSEIRCINSELNLLNSIVSATECNTTITIQLCDSVGVSYCNLQNRSGEIFGNEFSEEFGQLIATNINGDSCDVYNNIFLDPLFYTTAGDSAFYLTEDSPCIDAGDPASPLDPDSTRADIGAFYFDQSIASPLAVTLTPSVTPITIPANGGNFAFNIELSNTGVNPVNVDIWSMITLPNGSEFGPIINFPGFNLQPGINPNRDRDQNIPANAPSGNYTYDAYIGEYPDSIFAEDHFNFEKLAVWDGFANVDDWNCWGESFDDAVLTSVNSVPNYLFFNAFPNPFNQHTVLDFVLPSAGKVSLTVFDITGREVVMLVDGMKTAGQHQVVFDAEDLTSGVYFAWLEAGEFKEVRKILLVK